MRRREFISLVGATTAAWPLVTRSLGRPQAATSNQPVPRCGPPERALIDRHELGVRANMSQSPTAASPAADEAMAKLTELFSDPNLPSKAQFRCSTEGPTEFDIWFESIIDEQFGYNSNSEYKGWVRSLYRLGLIPRIPSEWEAPETPEGQSPA